MNLNLVKLNDNKYYINKEVIVRFVNVYIANEVIDENNVRYIWIEGDLGYSYKYNKKFNIENLFNNIFTLEFDEPKTVINKAKFIGIDEDNFPGISNEKYKFEIIDEEINKDDLIVEMYNLIVELKNENGELREKIKYIEKVVDSISEHFSDRRNSYDY